jgi:hypothetical protein
MRAPTSAAADLSPRTAAPAQELIAEHARVLRGASRWHWLPLCLLLGHRRTVTPWSRWAFGWDRETECARCGKLWHEQARTPPRD